MDHTLLSILIFYTGTIVGSFLNVCIYRIPRSISIVHPGSFCPHCKQPIKWWYNIPIFSYIFLKGHCAFCRIKISWQYPIIELSAGILAIVIFNKFSDYHLFFFYLQFSYGLLIISIIDKKFRIIPNKILLFLLLTGNIIILLCDVISWNAAISGLLISVFIMYFIRLMGNYFLKEESLGWGDIKLAGVIGFYVGWYAFTQALLIGSTLAILIYVVQSAFKNEKQYKIIPLAPYLSAGTLISLLMV